MKHKIKWICLFLFVALFARAYQLNSIEHASTTNKVYSWTNTDTAYSYISSVYFMSPGVSNTIWMKLQVNTSNTLLFTTASSTNMTSVILQPDVLHGFLVRSNHILIVSNTVCSNFTVIINREYTP